MSVWRLLGRLFARVKSAPPSARPELTPEEPRRPSPQAYSAEPATDPGPTVVSIEAGVVVSGYDPGVDLHPDYPFQIVGESHYQEALREIVEASADPGPNWPFKGAQCEVCASLVPEDDNPYDDQAVRVEIQGHRVGHLSRADARQYRRIFEKNPIPLQALIVGGWDHTDRAARGAAYENVTGLFGVRLAFKMEER
jgi:hypothetical protein